MGLHMNVQIFFTDSCIRTQGARERFLIHMPVPDVLRKPVIRVESHAAHRTLDVPFMFCLVIVQVSANREIFAANITLEIRG